MTIGELEQLAGITDRNAFWMRFANDQSIARDEIFHLAVAELHRRARERGNLPPEPDKRRRSRR